MIGVREYVHNAGYVHLPFFGLTSRRSIRGKRERVTNKPTRVEDMAALISHLIAIVFVCQHHLYHSRVSENVSEEPLPRTAVGRGYRRSVWS